MLWWEKMLDREPGRITLCIIYYFFIHIHLVDKQVQSDVNIYPPPLFFVLFTLLIQQHEKFKNMLQLILRFLTGAKRLNTVVQDYSYIKSLFRYLLFSTVCINAHY